MRSKCMPFIQTERQIVDVRCAWNISKAWLTKDTKHSDNEYIIPSKCTADCDWY